MFGGHVSLLVGVTVVTVALLIGVPFGLISGFFGKWADIIIMRVADTQLAIPFILLAIAIMAILGTGLGNVIFVLGVSSWVGYAGRYPATAMSSVCAPCPLSRRRALYGMTRPSGSHPPPVAQRVDTRPGAGDPGRGRGHPG